MLSIDRCGEAAWLQKMEMRFAALYLFIFLSSNENTITKATEMMIPKDIIKVDSSS